MSNSSPTPWTVFRFRYQPGNGTAYGLTVVIDPRGRLVSVSWPDLNWSAGDFGANAPSAEWLLHSGGVKRADDAESISNACAMCLDAWKHGEGNPAPAFDLDGERLADPCEHGTDPNRCPWCKRAAAAAGGDS